MYPGCSRSPNLVYNWYTYSFREKKKLNFNKFLENIHIYVQLESLDPRSKQAEKKENNYNIWNLKAHAHFANYTKIHLPVWLHI